MREAADAAGRRDTWRKMTWRELRNVCRRRSDYLITLFLTNELSLILTWFLVRTRVTPNQVTITSILCAFLCGVAYGMGYFVIGSALLFLSHVLDCTDGNLARAKRLFSPLGKWLDAVGDRLGETFVFLGAAFYFLQGEGSLAWTCATLFSALLLALYYYLVDMGLALGISSPTQALGGLEARGVHIKWGIMEPVIYGFVILTPLGWIKIQILLVAAMAAGGILYQGVRRIRQLRGVCKVSGEETGQEQELES